MRGIPFRREAEEPEAVEPEPVEEPLPEHKLTVVVVEDTVDVRDMLRMTLRSAASRSSPRPATARWASRSSSASSPTSCVLDLAMPDTGGLEILPLVHGACSKARVVVYSAIGATYMTEAALNAGAYAYIQKGVSPRSIIEHLHRVAHAGAQRRCDLSPLVRDYCLTGRTSSDPSSCGTSGSRDVAGSSHGRDMSGGGGPRPAIIGSRRDCLDHTETADTRPGRQARVRQHRCRRSVSPAPDDQRLAGGGLAQHRQPVAACGAARPAYDERLAQRLAGGLELGQPAPRCAARSAATWCSQVEDAGARPRCRCRTR